jgi:hypothetical protein
MFNIARQIGFRRLWRYKSQLIRICCKENLNPIVIAEFNEISGICHILRFIERSNQIHERHELSHVSHLVHGNAIFISFYGLSRLQM